jgi:cytochrome c biogenesis protein CcmG, thiol:disulfide interchange protein DsbE
MAKPFVRMFFALILALSGAALAVEVGGAAPAVTFKPMADSTAPASLASLKGSVVYVDFWASWCTPCLRSMPALRTLYGKHKDQGFVVVGVNKDVSPAEAERFLRRFPVSFPLVSDTDDSVAKAFDVKTMPSGYLIDRTGTVRQVLRGFTAETEVALSKQVADLLAAKP